MTEAAAGRGASTAKGERRRQALVEAAVELLDEEGFDGVRHRAVADRAGLPLASTTYYFSSLQELVLAALEHSARTENADRRAELAALTAEGDDALPAVVELLLDTLLGPAARGPAAVVRRYERFVAVARRPWVGPLMRETRPDLDALLHDALARAGRRFGPGELGRLVALVDGTVVNAFISADIDPREAARRVLHQEL